jgi:hypothetical protein
MEISVTSELNKITKWILFLKSVSFLSRIMFGRYFQHHIGIEHKFRHEGGGGGGGGGGWCGWGELTVTVSINPRSLQCDVETKLRNL